MKRWIIIILAFITYLLLLLVPYVPLPMAFPDVLYQHFCYIYKALATILPFIFLGGLVISGIIIVFFKKVQFISTRLLLYLFVLIVISIITNKLFLPNLIDFSKGYAVKRAELLFNPLENYKKAHGNYPLLMSDLVPDFIDKIPATKIISVPSLSYSKGQEGYSIIMVQRINGWDVDIILYNSAGDYDTTQKLKRFGNWYYYRVER